jgi:hypothetical protein
MTQSRRIADGSAAFNGKRKCETCGVVKPLRDYRPGYGSCRDCARALFHRARERLIGSNGHLGTYERYDAAELRPFAGRPGVMDAFDLPSRHMGMRTWRDGRSAPVTDTAA